MALHTSSLRRLGACAIFVLATSCGFLGVGGASSSQDSWPNYAVNASGRRPFISRPFASLSEVSGLAEQPLTIRRDLAEAFCIHAYRLPHKASFSDELAFLCDDAGKPSEILDQLDRFAKVVGERPQAVQLEVGQEGAFTGAVFAAAYALPIPPKWIKSGHIQDYMMTRCEFPYATLDGKVVANLYDNVGGDLQFSRFKFNYRTDVKTPDQSAFINERDTEFNAYQVQGGNPDIGLGTEHLLAANPDFPYFNTITVTIGTESGGSILITIIRGSVRHNGFPDLAHRVFGDTTLSQATNVHDGLAFELRDFVIAKP